MSTYLLTWNPDKWPWSNLEQVVAHLAEIGNLLDNWSCGLNKGIQIGDRVFLLRQGVEPRGIFASGHAESTYFTKPHWDPKLAAAGKTANYIEVKFDHLFDPSDQIIPRSDLGQGKLGEMHWDTQMSGTRIPDYVAALLENEWNRLIRLSPSINEFEPFAVEGLVTETISYSRGRSVTLRKQALAKANGVCAVCDTDFKRVLKGKGIRVLQVHHIKQMASSDVPRITSLSDLAVVCANCHMLIHSNPTKSIPISEIRLEIGSCP